MAFVFCRCADAWPACLLMRGGVSGLWDVRWVGSWRMERLQLGPKSARCDAEVIWKLHLDCLCAGSGLLRKDGLSG